MDEPTSDRLDEMVRGTAIRDSLRERSNSRIASIGGLKGANEVAQ